MEDEQKSKLSFLGIFPKCPSYKPIPVLINLVLIAFGTGGLYYFNLWAAVVYSIFSILFYFLVMPLTICKYCYFKVTETTIDKEKGKIIKKLLSVDKWSESHLHKHVGQKHWVGLMMIVWFLPIVLIIISFFLNFSIFALISLIGFIVVLAVNIIHMIGKVCTTCVIKDECHAAF